MTDPTELQINEDSYGKATATLTSDGSTAIALASVDSIVMTLVDKTGAVINSRNNQDVLGVNNGELHATSGLFTWEIQPLDTAIIGDTQIGQRESHLATFTITWDTTKQMHFEILLQVLNLRSVPQSS